MEKGITRNQILAELSKSPHGKLSEYVPIGKQAATQEPEFMAHLIAWDRNKGQVRDAKVALPIVTLSIPDFPEELADNSLAHFGLLGPREMLRGLRFALELKVPGKFRTLRRVVESYLREKETIWPKWDRVAVQHRKTLKELYALTHIKPGKHADGILFKGEQPKGSIFAAIAQLPSMSAHEAAGAVLQWKIPFLIAQGALGKKAQEPDLVLALIERMSPTELITNTKFLQRLGVKTNPVLRGAFEKALEKASASKANVLKTTRAAEALDDDEEPLKEKLRGVQERQIQALSGVEGNWLVLSDKSASMSQAIETSREVAATLAKMVKGKVWLVFFDTQPQTIDVTGCALDVIKKATQYIKADGGTSIGCGLQRMLEEKVEVDGIVIVSDAAENTPPLFPDVYTRYCSMLGKQVPVYLYRCQDMYPGHYATRELSVYMRSAGHDLQEFDIRSGVDYYSLPNLVSTMRTNRYSILDEIMATPLLTIKEVLPNYGRKEEAVAH